MMPLLVAAFFTREARSEPFAQNLYELNRGKKCDPASAAEVETEGQCLQSSPNRGIKNLDQLSEFMLFKAIAKRESRQLRCEIKTTEKFVASSEEKTAALKKTCELLGPLKKAIDASNSFQKQLDELENHIPFKEEPPPEAKALIIKDEQIRILKQSLAQSLQIIRFLRSRNSFLNSPSVYDAMAHQLSDTRIFGHVLISANPDAACSNLRTNLDFYLKQDIKNLRETQDYIDESLKGDWLSDKKFKTAMWNSPVRNAVLGPLANDAQMQNALLCRMDGRYGEGTKLENVVTVSKWLALGLVTAGGADYFAGSRLGAEVVSVAGEASETTSALNSVVAGSRFEFGSEALSSMATAVGLTASKEGIERSYSVCMKPQQQAAAAAEYCQTTDHDAFKNLFYLRQKADSCVWSTLTTLSMIIPTAVQLSKVFGETASTEIQASEQSLSDIFKNAAPEESSKSANEVVLKNPTTIAAPPEEPLVEAPVDARDRASNRVRINSQSQRDSTAEDRMDRASSRISERSKSADRDASRKIARDTHEPFDNLDHPSSDFLNRPKFNIDANSSEYLANKHSIPLGLEKLIVEITSGIPAKVQKALRQLDILRNALQKKPNIKYEDLSAFERANIEKPTWTHLQARSRVSNGITNYFPSRAKAMEAQTEIEKAWARDSLGFKVVSSDSSTTTYQYSLDGTRYKLIVCTAVTAQCPSKDFLLSIFPDCGPGVRMMDFHEFMFGLAEVSNTVHSHRGSSSDASDFQVTAEEIGFSTNPCH